MSSRHGKLHPSDGRESLDPSHRAQALSFGWYRTVSFPTVSLSRVRPKIISRREARFLSNGNNLVVDDSAMGSVIVATRRQLSRPGAEHAAIVVLMLLAVYEATRFDTYEGPLDSSGAIVVGLLTAVPFVLMPARPWLAASAATLLTITILHTGTPVLIIVSMCTSLLSVLHLVVRRGLLPAAPLLIPFLVIAMVRLTGPYHAPGSYAPLLFFLAVLAVGDSVRRRKLAVAALGVSEEAMAESARAQTMMEERARIARELHDIVAHHLSVIAIQSEAARLTSPDLPAAAGDRLGEIADTARVALTETRRLLGVLRADTGGGSGRIPQPGLDQLDDLVEKAESTGTSVRLIRQGKVAALPLSTDLAAYRRRTTARVQPGATTRPRRWSLRSRPRGCRRPRALRWQPSAGVQRLELRGAIGARRESAVPEPCFHRRRAVVAARAIQSAGPRHRGRFVRRGSGCPRCRTSAP
jgi:signal transduction histidine kinase